MLLSTWKFWWAGLPLGMPDIVGQKLVCCWMSDPFPSTFLIEKLCWRQGHGYLGGPWGEDVCVQVWKTGPPAILPQTDCSVEITKFGFHFSIFSRFLFLVSQKYPSPLLFQVFVRILHIAFFKKKTPILSRFDSARLPLLLSLSTSLMGRSVWYFEFPFHSVTCWSSRKSQKYIWPICIDLYNFFEEEFASHSKIAKVSFSLR